MLAHMNADHADAVQLYATRLLSRAGGDWVLTGVDPEGCDLRQGAETARLWFDAAGHAMRTAPGRSWSAWSGGRAQRRRPDSLSSRVRSWGK